jgi:hypothetical protein
MFHNEQFMGEMQGAKGGLDSEGSAANPMRKLVLCGANFRWDSVRGLRYD